MAITKPSDLFDFDKWAAELAKLTSLKDKYTQSVIESNQRIQKSYDENLVKLKELEALMKATGTRARNSSGGSRGSMGADIDKTIASLERYRATLALIADHEKYATKSIEELDLALKLLNTQYKSLDPTSSTFVADQQRVANQAKQVTQAINAQSQTLKAAKKTVDEANNSYKQLSRQTADLKNQIRSMPGAYDLTTGAINKNNAAAVALAKQIKINDNALKKIDSTLGNHQRNVGNYSGALRDLSGAIIGFTTVAGAIGAVFMSISTGLKIIDEFTRLKLGLDAISASSEQAAQRFSFISSLADKTGQDISKLTTSYVDFAAATRTTALEGASGDKIFAAFTKTFSALGKSSEVAERGLYALQQMISKGKVSSEELNQQLAEALPGANKLFADALHVSTAELADMLKKGKVLSTDVLPLVAENLEKIYGSRAQNNLKTISGSFTRFTNQFKLLLDSLNNDKGVSSWFSNFNNAAADALKGLNRLIEKQGLLATLSGRGAGTVRQNAFDAKLVDEFKNDDVAGRVARLNIEITRLANMKDKLSLMDRKIDGSAYIKQNDEIKRQQGLVQDLVLAQKSLVKVQFDEAAAAKKNKPTPVKGDEDGGKVKKVLTQYEKLIDRAEALSKVISDDLLADFNAGRPLEVSDKTIDTWNKLYKQIEAVSQAVGQDVPSNLKKLDGSLNKTSLNIPAALLSANGTKDSTRNPNKDGSISNPTTDKTSQLQGLGNLLQSQDTGTKKLDNRLDNGMYKKFLESDKEALRQQLREIQELELQSQQAVTDAEKEGVEARIKLAEDEFARKTELAKTHLEERKQLEEAITELVSTAGQAAFQIMSDQNEADIAANQAKMDHELSLVAGNAEAEKKIKEEYAKKELALRQKQAKIAKAEAAFQIVLSTAMAIAKANAAGPFLSIPLMIIAAAAGAIQLAAVLSKPIPQFFKGTQNAPEGPAQVAERGPEIRESKGKMTLYEKPGIVNLNRGDKIYTADQTRQMLSASAKAGELSNITSANKAGDQTLSDVIKYQVIIMNGKSQPEFDYNKIKNSFAEALEGQAVNETIFDEKGVSHFLRKKDLRVKSYNARYSLS